MFRCESKSIGTRRSAVQVDGMGRSRRQLPRICQGPGSGAGVCTMGHESRQSWQLHAGSIAPPALGSGSRIDWLQRYESYMYKYVRTSICTNQCSLNQMGQRQRLEAPLTRTKRKKHIPVHKQKQQTIRDIHYTPRA